MVSFRTFYYGFPICRVLIFSAVVCCCADSRTSSIATAEPPSTLTLKSTKQQTRIIMTDKRVTMIKPVVGKVKSPAYALPESDFVYGIESKLDKEGAGEGEEQSALCILIQTSPFTIAT